MFYPPPRKISIAPDYAVNDVFDDVFIEPFEAEVSSGPEPSKNIETENLERKILADTDIKTGDCGENVTYTLDGETLTISGSGKMSDYSTASDVPWNDYKDSIKSVIIEGNVQSIGTSAFSGCIWLKFVTIPDSVQSIGTNAFSGCILLKSVELNNDYVISNFSSVFSGIKQNITSVTIGNGVTSIGYDAFYGCSGLQSINVSEDNTNYKSEDGVLFSKDGATLILYPAGKTDTSYSISDNVTSIGNSAFRSCSKLTSVTIPDSVESIERDAFYGCNILTYVELNNDYVVSNFSNVFSSIKNNITSVTIGNDVTLIREYTFMDCSRLTYVTIGNGVTSIGDRAFENCSELISLTYSGISEPENSNNVFNRCNNINSVNVPTNYEGNTFCGIKVNKIVKPGNLYTGSCGNNVTYTFDGETLIISGSGTMFNFGYANICYVPWYYYKDSIKGIVIEDGVESIGGRDAFCDCSSLTSVTIPSSVTSIGNFAFEGCSNLTSVTYNGISEPENSGSVFEGCSKLTSVNVPTNYEGNTFCGIKVNKTITPDTPDKPGNQDTGTCGENVTYTFDRETETLTISGSGEMSEFYSSNAPWNDYKDSIKSVVIQDGVQSIGDYAFYYCSYLTSITIPDSVTSIEYGAFYGCSNLTSVTIPGSVKSIGDRAFSDCSSLTSVTIPDSVTSIGDYAFRDCSSLTSVTYNGISEPTNSGSVFEGCSKLTSVNVPTNYEGNTFCGIKVNKTITPDTPDKPGNQDTGTCGENVTYTFDRETETLTISGSGEMSEFYSPSDIPWYNYKNSIKFVVIEDGVQSIAVGAFAYCSSLISVTIGNGVQSIGDYAFRYCNNLTSVTYNGISEPTNSGSVFEGCNITSVDVPTNYEGNTFCGIKVNKTITPDTPDKPGNQDTGNCGENVTYTFDGETLTISGSGAMFDYSNDSFAPWYAYKDSIKRVVIEYGVQSIGDYAFAGCSNLVSVTIGNGVQSIGNSAFKGCSSLTSITIPGSVTSIGDSAFSDCSNLNSVTYNGSVAPNIGDSAFNGCNITSVNVPTNYEGEKFGNMPVNKTITPENPGKPKKPSKKGKKAGIIAGAVIGGLVVVGIIAVIVVMYVKKLGCFARFADSLSEVSV